MTNKTGIYKAIKSAGNQKELAFQLGVSQQAISHWNRQGFVPVNRVVEIESQYGVNRLELIDPSIVDLVNPLKDFA